MVLFIVGSIVFLFGFRILKETLFPLFILLFMIPVPSQIFSAATIKLQLFVSQASSLLVSFLGIPLFREGNVIQLPERTLQVVQACSGLRSLITLLTLSAVFGYFTLRSNLLRTVLFFSGVPIAVFVNIVRVTLLICFLHFLGLDLTHGTAHTWFGLGIFGLALVLLFMIKGLIARWDTASPGD
jgi:exosortase